MYKPNFKEAAEKLLPAASFFIIKGNTAIGQALLLIIILFRDNQIR